MPNYDIREYALRKGVRFWRIAEKLGYSHESCFSRILRRELPPEKKAEIIKIIDELADENISENQFEKSLISYASAMNDKQKQHLLACAEQILLKESEE